MTLADVMPHEFVGPEYTGTRAYKLRDETVVAVYDSTKGWCKPWPGNHRNVHFWVALANGKAVAWNENPQQGWSFPVITHRE